MGNPTFYHEHFRGFQENHVAMSAFKGWRCCCSMLESTMERSPTHQKIDTSAASHPLWNSCDWFRSGVPAKVSMIHLGNHRKVHLKVPCNALRLSDWPRVAGGTITTGIEVDMPRWGRKNTLPWKAGEKWKLECQTKKDVSFTSKQVQTAAVALIMGKTGNKKKQLYTQTFRVIWKELKRRLQLPNQLRHFSHFLPSWNQGFCSVSRGWVSWAPFVFSKAQLGVKGFVKWRTTGSSALQVVLLREVWLVESQLFRRIACPKKEPACFLVFSAFLKIWYDDKYSVWVSLVYMLSHAIWVKIIYLSEISKQFNIHIPNQNFQCWSLRIPLNVPKRFHDSTGSSVFTESKQAP